VNLILWFNYVCQAEVHYLGRSPYERYVARIAGTVDGQTVEAQY
jgi:hypothetical protein